MAARSQLETEEIWERFHEAVNMTSRELLDWLGTHPDLAPHPGDNQPAELGLAVVQVLAKRRTDLTDDDLETMRKVVDVVEEETEGVAEEEFANDERRRYRLLNVGHDPLRSK
jgi:Protein of unknown function (DUF3140)